MSGKTAMVTGITGQDGSYLAELLLDKGYTVYGLVRRVSQPTSGRSLINHLLTNENFNLVNGDLADQNSIDTQHLFLLRQFVIFHSLFYRYPFQ